MEIKKKNHHFDVDVVMNEAEVQSIVGMIEELCMYKQQSFESVKGLRAEIYQKLTKVLDPHSL